MAKLEEMGSLLSDLSDMFLEETEEEEATTKPPEVEGTWEEEKPHGHGIIQKTKEKAQAFAGGVLGTVESGLHGLEWLGSDIAGDLAEPLTEIREEYLTPEHQTLLNDVAGGFGSMLAFLLPGTTIARIPSMVAKGVTMTKTAAKALEMAGIAVSSGFEALTEAGSVYKDLKTQGKTEEEASQGAFETFMVNAALLGFTNKASGFFEIGGGLLKKAITGTVAEGVQEAGQSMVSQLETTGKLDIKQAGYEGLIGGIVGGGTGGVISLIDKVALPDKDKDKGYDPNAPVDLTDSSTFNQGITDKQKTEANDNSRFTEMIRQGQRKAQETIDQQTADQLEEQERLYIEKTNLEKEQAAFIEAETEKEKNKQFLDSISTKEGLMQTAGELIAPLEESEVAKDNVAAKAIRDAHKAIFMEDFSARKVRDLQYDLNELAQRTENIYVGAVASGLSNQLDIELERAEQRERDIEEGKKLVKERAETEKRTQQGAKERAKEFTTRRAAATDTAEVVAAKKESRAKEERAKELAPRLIKERVTTEAPTVAQPKIESPVTSSEKLEQMRQRTLAKKALSEQTAQAAAIAKTEAAKSGLKEQATTGVPIVKPPVEEKPKTGPMYALKQKLEQQAKDRLERQRRDVEAARRGIKRADTTRYSKVITEHTTAATKATDEVNKTIPGVVRYDGSWKDVDGQQFTTTKQIGNMDAGQTIVVKNGKVNTKSLKEAINLKAKEYGETKLPFPDVGVTRYSKEDLEPSATKQNLQTKSKSFKKWFGKSKVTENGTPKIVYHGTDKDFNIFERKDIGYHFGTAKQADERLKLRSPFYGQYSKGNKLNVPEGQNIMPVYLKLENPIRLPDVGFWDDPRLVALALLEKDKVDMATAFKFKAVNYSSNEYKKVGVDGLNELSNILKEKGYDGIIYENAHEQKGEDSYIVFDSNQIKSATGNIGTFSSESKDIRLAKGAEPSKGREPSSDFHSQVVEAIKPLTKLVAGRGLKTKILRNVSELKDETIAVDKLSKTKGIKTKDTVYLFTDSFKNTEDAIATWMHEHIGHEGLQKFCERYDIDYNKLLDMVHEEVSDLDLYKDLSKSYALETHTMSDEGKNRYLTEEFLAKRVESIDPFKRNKIWAKIRDFINKWLQKVFNKEGAPNLTLKHIDLILEAAKSHYIYNEMRQFNEYIKPTKDYVETVEYMIKNHPKALTWYDNHQKIISDIFGDDAGIFNILLALTSPGAYTVVNVKWAVETYLYLHGKAKMPKALFPAKLLKQLQDAIGNEFYTEALKSPRFKVQEFIRGLLGDPNATVGDRWMYRIFFGPSILNNGFLKLVAAGKNSIGDIDSDFSKTESYAVRHKLFEITNALNKKGYNLTPRQVQAALWVREVQLSRPFKLKDPKQIRLFFGKEFEKAEPVYDYEEGMTHPMPSLKGFTPARYLYRTMGKDKDKIGTLVNKLNLGRIPKIGTLDAEYQAYLKDKGIKPIKLETKPVKLNPKYFDDESGFINSLGMGIHFKNTFVPEGEYILAASKEGDYSTYSRNDVGKRIEASTEKNPYVPIVHFYEAGEGNVEPGPGGKPQVYNIDLSKYKIYDTETDSFGIKPKLEKALKEDPNAHYGNVFGRLVQEAGFDGFTVIRDSGRLIYMFDKVIAENPKVKANIAISDVIQSVEKLPQDIKVLEKALGKRAKRFLDKMKETKKEYPDITIVDHRPATAQFKGATEGQREIGGILSVEGPLPAVRAFASQVSMEHAQNYVYVMHTTNVTPDNASGTFFRFKVHKDFKNINEVAQKIQQQGLTEFNIGMDQRSGSIWIDQFVMSPEDLDRFKKLYNTIGDKSFPKNSFEKVISEVYTKEASEDWTVQEWETEYKKPLVKYFGETKGEQIYDRAKERQQRFYETRRRDSEGTGVRGEQKQGGKSLGDIQAEPNSEIRYSKVIEKVSTTEESDRVDQTSAKAGNLDNRTFVNHLWQLRDEAGHSASLLAKELEQELYSIVGRGDKTIKRTADTDLTQKAIHLYLDTEGKLDEVRKYYGKIQEELKTATGEDKIRLNDQKEIIERMGQLTKETKDWAEKRLNSLYYKWLKEGQKYDIIKTFQENYVRRIWNPPKGMGDEWRFWGAHKQRTLGSIIGGWERGFTLRVEGAIPALESYMNELSTTIAFKTFQEYGMNLKDVNGTPLFVKGEEKAKELNYIALKNPLLKDVYAPRGIAKILNKMALRDQMFSTTPIAKHILRYNAAMKGWILSVSFFHYLAGIRSWYFGVQGGTKNFWKAYKNGVQKIDLMSPILQMGIKNGLTLGKVQDFDENIIKESRGLVEYLVSKTGSIAGVKGIRKLQLGRERFTKHLFGKFFAGLKAEAFCVEYAHWLKKEQKDFAKGKIDKVDADLVAERVALLINADFGGLHLGRFARHPSLQKLSRLILLATDWTESNFRTVTGALGLNQLISKALGETPKPPGMGKLYRRFWTGATIKMIASTLMTQALVYALFGDDDDKMSDFYKSQFGSWDQFKKLKWTEVNITPILKAFDYKTDTQKTLSVVGHFADPAKLIDPMNLFKGKVSPVGRQFEQLYTGSDWAERPFTSVERLVETGKTIEKSRFNEKSGFFNRLPSTLLNNIRAMQPIMLQQLTNYLMGEEDGLTALGRSVGLKISNVWQGDGGYSDIKSEINKLSKNLKDAYLIKDAEEIAKAKQDIKDYGGYGRIKLYIKTVDKALEPVNARIKFYDKVKEKRKLTPDQQAIYESLMERRAGLKQKVIDVHKKIHG